MVTHFCAFWFMHSVAILRLISITWIWFINIQCSADSGDFTSHYWFTRCFVAYIFGTCIRFCLKKVPSNGIPWLGSFHRREILRTDRKICVFILAVTSTSLLNRTQTIKRNCYRCSNVCRHVEAVEYYRRRILSAIHAAYVIYWFCCSTSLCCFCHHVVVASASFITRTTSFYLLIQLARCVAQQFAHTSNSCHIFAQIYQIRA